MIIARVSLGLSGGSTDIPSYSNKDGGSVVTSVVDRHIYVLVKDPFEKTVRMSCSITEIEDAIEN